MVAKKQGSSLLALPWNELNQQILKMNDQDELAGLLDEEAKKASPRKQIMLRIHSRLNKIRAHAERAALMKDTKRSSGGKTGGG